MNNYRTTLLAAALLLAASAASADPSAIGKRIREVPDAPVEVEIWTNRGEGASYCDGDSIEIYFRTNIDAYVAIYDIDTTGRIQRLFPNRRARDNFVYGGQVNRVPSSYGHHFEVEGPSGWETLRAVAAIDPRDLSLYHRYDAPAGYSSTRPIEPIASPARNTSDRPTPWHHKIREAPGPSRIREVPDTSSVAVAEAQHFVRDGYRCRPHPRRPWWLHR